MEPSKTNRTESGFGWRLCVAAAAPFLAASAYLLVTRVFWVGFTVLSDWICLVVSVFSGVIFLSGLPVSPRKRVFWLLVYVPVVTTLLLVYMAWFVWSLSLKDVR
jgi:hypothetical protein